MKERILITGMAGSIGSELARQLSVKKEEPVYGIDINESGLHEVLLETEVNGRVADIRNYETVNDVFSDIRPTIVYHAAAYKSVNMMELTPLEAIQTNVVGTYNVIHCARRYETKKFVYISSDKVVNANSVMGQTKKLGETMVRNQGEGFVVVRFGNVLGSRGSVIPIWQRQMNENKPVTVTDERATRYFMTIEEAVKLVIEAGQTGEGGEIYILDMGKQVNVLELAKKIVKDHPIKMIGLRPGETLDEKLMTLEEEQRAIKKGKYYVIS